ncbi:unnamed protein product [Phytophthora fragariaefolia]|uniref:Unnamed protein product n=1 Tax=Phytophthora fragariaefolia TaxID=1490495 RepID=A0A9W7CR59_9STRA|nr:unnamed protein product [Phytophthora fragariaefolia]
MGRVSATSSLNTNDLTWIIDTGAKSHMCKDIGVFVTFEPLGSNMETAANPPRILGKGTVRFPVKDATNAVRSVELQDVNYVPRVAHNLFSVIKAPVNDGFKISIDKRECTLRHDGDGYVLSAPGVIHSRDVRFNEAEFPKFADRVLAALLDARRRLCGSHHCDDHLAKATASVEASLRDENAVTKDHLRRRQSRTGEATYSTSSGINSRRRTGKVTYCTSSGTDWIRELSASDAMGN